MTMMNGGQEKKKVAVIGAGGSGLCSLKTCLEEGIEAICFDKADAVGGLWVYRNEDEEGLPSVMKSTVINSSKEMSAFSDFPPPDHFPSFMHNRYMTEYLQMYAKHFELNRHIRLKHDVLKVTPAEDYATTGKWLLFIKDLESGREWQEVFDAVMLCAGHHVYPIKPTLPGLDSFKGTKLHTHSLKTSKGMEDKDVLIVGNGNSGVDAAVEISSVAKRVYLSTRRGFWLISRFAPGGFPLDALFNTRFFSNCFPYSFGGFILEAVANFRVNHKRFNLKPKHSLIAQHPTLNDYLPARILSGTVQIRGSVDHFTEKGVVFTGQEPEVPLDTVVLATGYSYKVPFLDSDKVRVNDQECHLYRLVFPPDLSHPTLGFIGIIQPVGAIFPISEMQARWFVQLLKGKCKLPSSGDMRREIKAREDFLSSFFIKAPRHLTEVIWIEYMDSVASEIGAKPNLLKLFLSDPVFGLHCLFGPCLPYQFRIQGPHTWPGARKAILGYRKRTQAPLDTRKIVQIDVGRTGKKILSPSQFWAIFLVPFFLYILLIIM